MIDALEDQLQLHDTDPHKGPMLTLWSDDVDKIEVFKHLCYANLPKTLGWFHQSNCRDFQMFEFWNPQTEGMEAAAQRIADAMELTLTTTFSKSYRPGVEIALEQYFV